MSLSVAVAWERLVRCAMIISRASACYGDSVFPGGWWDEFLRPATSFQVEDEYNLIAETVIPSVQIFPPGHPDNVLVKFESVAFKFTFREEKHWVALARLNLLSRRLRSYLAVVATVPVPLRYVFAGDRILMPFQHTVPEGLVPWRLIQMDGAGLSPKRMSAFAERLPALLRHADTLVTVEDPGTLIDRAVLHLGEAIWSEDDLYRFFEGWLAIDAIASEDWRIAREAFLSGRNHCDEKWCVDSFGRYRGAQPRRVPLSIRTRFAVHKRLSLDISDDIDVLTKLRNDVAHADLSAGSFFKIQEKFGRLFSIAYAMTTDAMVEARPDMSAVITALPVSKIPPATVVYEEDETLKKVVREQLRKEAIESDRRREAGGS